MSSAKSLPPAIDIAVIGAGIHSLTLVAHLLQKRRHMRQKLWVFDPSGEWMTRWQHQFAALEIPHLRSPAVHHPDPNPYELRRFAESRPQELFPPYDLPGTQLFQDFCWDVIQRQQLTASVIQARVKQIVPLTETSRSQFQLELDDGRSIVARRVVLATGGGKVQMPQWVNSVGSDYPPERLCHSGKIDLRGCHLAGERVVIVGGGLTAGHLAVGAIARGATVHLMVRRHLQEKLFDAEPGWLGPKYLKDFSAEPDWEKRWELIQLARNGGSMTPAMMSQLRRYQKDDRLQIDDRCQIVKAKWLDHRWQVYCDRGQEYECDRIWLSTGTKLDAANEPLLSDILDAYPNAIVNGLPVLDDRLRWPGCELFVMGGLAGLQVGPVARNISGARMASDRIVPALTKSSLML
ncbi:MAG: lysine N(6)-hydroxylase/L-ornithine N(5)-oxygenase family protein [Cyanosarcina radialis HA8281-LM2]|nr:lysine N(6)-hydroxylase/L-ornithine N(5)-oxygenase family protein [Cyanosarcina radialis HA8281-LM2]